jgi:predicted naringenin-chalcone synthase
MIGMTVYIHRLETSVPETHYEQPYACELMQRNVSDREAVKRVLRSIYHNSGIRKRHSVITDFNNTGDPPLFFNGDGTRAATPDTRRRNEVYTREARRHFTDLGDKLLRNAPGFDREDVTHLITVSCTGFFAPGPDYFVVRDLGLRSSTQRYHIGFMGCYAAFQGLKMAHAFCKNDPDAVVLVLCVELCTLHLQFSDDTDAMISASVFADGGSGALISARKPAVAAGMATSSGTSDKTKAEPSVPLEMSSFHSDLTSEGEGDMAWTIGNEGFEMRLSTYVPDIIRKNIGPALDTILTGAGLSRGDITRWAVHPGGRAILDKVQEALELDEEQIAASRAVLRDYGNMSSATILFVLKELVDAYRGKEPQTIFGMAFGPGLTIETGLFRIVPEPVGAESTTRSTAGNETNGAP